jgi:hypothetical protein
MVSLRFVQMSFVNRLAEHSISMIARSLVAKGILSSGGQRRLQRLSSAYRGATMDTPHIPRTEKGIKLIIYGIFIISNMA